MPCHICKSTAHRIFDCTSNRAKHAYEATHHWIENRLIQMYSTNEIFYNIHFLALQYQFSRLNKGDLLFINKEWLDEDNSDDIPLLIYTILLHKTLELYYKTIHENVHGFSDINIKIMHK